MLRTHIETHLTSSLRRYYEKENLEDIAKLLIGKGADVNAKNEYGSTPLHLLCGYYRRLDGMILQKRLKET